MNIFLIIVAVLVICYLAGMVWAWRWVGGAAPGHVSLRKRLGLACIWPLVAFVLLIGVRVQ